MEQVILPFSLACHVVFSFPFMVFGHLELCTDCIQLWQCYQDLNDLLPFGFFRECALWHDEALSDLEICLSH